MADSDVWFKRMHDLLDEIKRDASMIYFDTGGKSYHTDWGYGIEAIEYFIEILEDRYGGERE